MKAGKQHIMESLEVIEDVCRKLDRRSASALRKEARAEIARAARKARRNGWWLYSILAPAASVLRARSVRIGRLREERRRARETMSRTMRDIVTDLVTRRYGVRPIEGSVCVADNVFYHTHECNERRYCVRCGADADRVEHDMRGRRAALEREEILRRLSERRARAASETKR